MQDRNAECSSHIQASPDSQPIDATSSILCLTAATEVLAETRLVERQEPGFPSKAFTSCSECFRSALGGAPIGHAFSCCVGQALMAAKIVRDELFARARALKFRPVVEEVFDHVGPGAPLPTGILRAPSAPIEPVKTSMEQNFIAGAPVRTIVYDVCGVDLAPTEILVYENGSDHARVATHEEAAAFRGEVFNEAAK